MIIQIKGNVNFPITLDPSVWIFDDRKIKWDDFFNKDITLENEETVPTDVFDQVDYQERVKPPVKNKITASNRKEWLSNTYVMPLIDFLNHAEIKKEATNAVLQTDDDSHTVDIEQLKDGLLLFAIDGRQIKEQGPAYFLFADGSNKENPIKGIKQIKII
ncbi:hypothetical protein [Saliterribacillus persicus]|uniref:Peptidyl-prolyl cis-trans isomerase n=1 Tax=Saliterribacillus persicus TaxID=930114 RepID=A0A368XWD6_9BACI|nr:hypothetical protein [Saliterribacillus persicus]RCW70837.1 hypothetical protein DFR57_106238 [Saliterribacillus persicus]